jgi:rhamnose transport system ATP-binding protein
MVKGMNEKILELRNITKEFPGVVALNNVDFNLKYGEIHTLVGENGAGKSTLVKIITGIYTQTSGDIIYEGESVLWHSPIESIRRGIAAIYQEPTIFPDLNVAENIFMGHQRYNNITRKINWRYLYKETNKIMNELNVNIKPRDRIRGLSVAERQLVEIAKALSTNAKILIMDEPTSSLSISESKKLFSIIHDLKKKGTSIIFISHKLEDIFDVTDRVTVLRDGNYIATKDMKHVSQDELIQMMVGRELKNLFPKLEVKQGSELLRVEGLSRKGKFRDVSFCLHEGEILGFYGLVGAGRTEVAKAIFGMEPANSGKIFIRGKEVKITNPNTAIELGMGYVSENRDEEGIILNMSITSNISLPVLERFSKFGWLDNKAERKTAKEYSEMMDVRATSLEQNVLNLSGGNKQKVSLAKWLATKSKILLFDEPTKGIDVGAKATIHKFISELASKGFGILMISSELPEILGMSDNILVMHEGLITDYYKRSEATQEKIIASAIANSSNKVRF